MSITPEDAEKVRSDFASYLSRKRKASTEKRRKVRNRYVVAIRNGENLDDVKNECMQRFGVSSSHYDKIVANKYNDGTPRGDAMTDAMIIVEIQKLQAVRDRVSEWCEDQLCKIDEAEERGESAYGLEVTETRGGKTDITTFKKIPLDEARYLVLRREVEASRHFFDVVGKLKGPQTLIQVNTSDRFADVTAAEIQRDLRERIRTEEERSKVRNSVIADGGTGDESEKT